MFQTAIVIETQAQCDINKPGIALTTDTMSKTSPPPHMNTPLSFFNKLSFFLCLILCNTVRQWFLLLQIKCVTSFATFECLEFEIHSRIFRNLRILIFLLMMSYKTIFFSHRFLICLHTCF